MVEPSKCIGNDVVFTRNKVKARIELFDKIEPANDSVRSSIVSCNVKVVVWMCNFAPRSMVQNLVRTMMMERFFITHSVFQLGVIEFVQPKGHWFVVLDNVDSHLVAGGISINVKGFIVVRVNKKAIMCHERFHAFEGKIHFRIPAKCFLPRLAGKRC